MSLAVLIGLLLIGILILVMLYHQNKSSNDFRLITPLTEDPSIGGYTVSLVLENQSFIVVPDTGSSLLLVSGADCQECDHSKGSWKDVNTGATGKIRYLGGQVTHYRPTKGRLRGDNGEIHVDLGVIRSHTGISKHYCNVLGLQQRVGKSFLTSLWQSNDKQLIVFDFPNSLFGLGNVLELVRTPIATWPFFSSAKGYLMSRLQSFDGQYFVLWDTGSTLTSLPSSIYQHFEETSTITLTFEDSTTPITFQYSPRSITSLVPSKRFPLDNVIIVGNLWLRQYGIAFDFNTMTMTAFQ